MTGHREPGIRPRSSGLGPLNVLDVLGRLKLGRESFPPRASGTGTAERPTWLVAILVMVLSGVLMISIGAPKIDWEESISYRLEQRGRELPPKEEEALVRSLASHGTSLMVIMIAVLPWIFCPLAAAIFLVGFRWMGSELPFKTSLSVLVHGLMPTVVQFFLVGLPMVLGTGEITAEKLDRGSWSNLGFLAGENPSPASVTFLAQMDLFSLWTIILLVIGYSIAAQVSKWRAAACVVGLWVLFVAATTGLAALD